MKIAIVSNSTWNIINFRMPLVYALRGAGHEVLVISPADRYVDRLVEEGVAHLDLFVDNKGVNPLHDLTTLRQLYNYYSRHRLDAVLHYTIKPVIYGGIVARMLGIPAVNTITGLGTVFIKQDWVTRTVRMLYRASLKRAYRVLFQNRDDRELFLCERLVPDALASIVPGSGIDTVRFCPDYATGNNREEIVFLLVARMLRDKGVCEYVEAARSIRQRHPKVRFQLLGPLGVENNTAISRQTVDAWVSEGVVEYNPPVDDVRPMLAQATCVVLPSYREGLPRALLEAGAMGKPLIATDVPGCREVVRDGVNGYLCRVADAADLASKIEDMIPLTVAQRKQMGEASRLHVIENFGEDAVIRTYLDVIETISSQDSAKV